MMTKEEAMKAAAARWVLVATNEGTYSADAALRAVGCGDPEFANCRIYEQVGTGQRRTEGCDEKRAPGWMRWFTRELAEAQAELAALRR